MLLQPSATGMWYYAARPFREVCASFAPPHRGCNGWNALLLSIPPWSALASLRLQRPSWCCPAVPPLLRVVMKHTAGLDRQCMLLPADGEKTAAAGAVALLPGGRGRETHRPQPRGSSSFPGPPARVRSSDCTVWRQNALLALRRDAACASQPRLRRRAMHCHQGGPPQQDRQKSASRC